MLNRIAKEVRSEPKASLVQTLIMSLLMGTLAMPAAAQIAESLKSKYHKEEDLGYRVVNGSSIGDVQRYVHDKDSKIIVLQAFVDEVPEATAVALVDWVRQGHSLWIYDSRLAEKYFGFKDYPLRAEQFRGKDEKGDLGGQSRRGKAAVAIAFGTHPVLTGVGEASCFFPTLEEDKSNPDKSRYPAVVVEADTVGLMRFAHDSPALCALRQEGRGLIVFKPLMWTQAYSGERIQMNLLELSAGYQVPGIGGEDLVGDPPGPKHDYVSGNPATPVVGSGGRVTATPMPVETPVAVATPSATTGLDRVAVGSESLEGTIITPEFRFETGGNSLMLKHADIKRVDIGGRLDLDLLTLSNGETHKGLWMTRKIELQNKDGTKVLEKADIKSIEFSNP